MRDVIHSVYGDVIPSGVGERADGEASEAARGGGAGSGGGAGEGQSTGT